MICSTAAVRAADVAATLTSGVEEGVLLGAGVEVSTVGVKVGGTVSVTVGDGPGVSVGKGVLDGSKVRVGGFALVAVCSGISAAVGNGAGVRVGAGESVRLTMGRPNTATAPATANKARDVPSHFHPVDMRVWRVR